MTWTRRPATTPWAQCARAATLAGFAFPQGRGARAKLVAFATEHGIPVPSRHHHHWYPEPAARRSPAAHRYASGRKRAVRTGIPFTLTFDEYLRLVENDRCEYCGGQLPLTGFGLDQKVPRGGYTLENVVPCCAPCNSLKGATLTHEQMREVSALLVRWRAAGAWPPQTGGRTPDGGVSPEGPGA